MSRPKVVIDLSDANCARDLAAGGMFVGSAAIASSGATLGYNDECDLVVRGGTGELTLHARVVFMDPAKGAGLELVGFDPAMKEQIALLAAAPPAVAPPQLDLDAPGELTLADEEHTDTEGQPITAEDAAADAEGAAADAAADAAEAADDSDEGKERKKLALTMHERLRGLTIVEQIKKANSADPAERMTLERIYGKTVWEHLLRNPRLTAPEVARLARLGTLPRTLIELIVNNGAWLQIPEVRRALLANPRLGVDQVLRVLRLLPKHELKVAASLMTYPLTVRDAAKRLLKGADS